MDVNDYVIDALVKQKLQEARVSATRHVLVSSLRPASPPLRERLGAALIALGERIVGTSSARPAHAARGAGRG